MIDGEIPTPLYPLCAQTQWNNSNPKTERKKLEMKRMIALTLVLALLLAGCGGKQAGTAPAGGQKPIPVTTAPAEMPAETAPTTEPTTVPTTEPVAYFDPLNGEILDAPFDGRIYASTISNIRDALPHVGVTKADVLMEMFVNGSIVRCLALFSDIGDVDALGSTRSTRMMFNNIAQHYDAILTHGGGSSQCISDANNRRLTHFNVDSLMRQGDPLMKGTAYRDTEYKYGEHNLFMIGPGVKAFAESQGVQLTGNPERDYGLRFTEDGTPDGEDAKEITVILTYNKAMKDTTMRYDDALGRYVYNQYGMEMRDQITDEVEAFRNVVVMYTDIGYDGIYHIGNFNVGGTGYFACGGKIIPITWTCDGDNEPFRYFHEDGTPLEFGQGNTYIAICTPDSAVTWNAEVTPAE